MIVVTGAAGFIGSQAMCSLAAVGERLVAIEDLPSLDAKRWSNAHSYREMVDFRQAFEWLYVNGRSVDFIIHLGAISSTAETDVALLRAKNTDFTLNLWRWCALAGKPIIYASSAATYGDGARGFSDRTDPLLLQPLNEYAKSKNAVDEFTYNAAAEGNQEPPFWYGLKFFNVYGPGEDHKGAMRSVARKLYGEASTGRDMTLFKDGHQKRDFVHVDDCVEIMIWLMEHKPESGLYNVGTGRAETFLNVADAVSAAFGGTSLRLVDMPETLKPRYQAFTEADISKLRKAGYRGEFLDVAEGVGAYVGALEEKRLAVT